ncbi:MAG: hypothetical protein M1831_004478 [Alyxoria varia]|nr:MAG: hypothetical protein M1831_004478 [Alyxoria varia]
MASHAEGQDDVEEQRRLAEGYEFGADGPAVSDKRPIAEIVSKYASHQIYAKKTQDLGAKFSEYRAVKGDGSCGWRAVLFSYFEILLHNDAGKVAQEKSRIQQVYATISSTRSDGTIDDFFEEGILSVLDQMATWLSESNPSTGQRKLLEYFSNEFDAAYSLFALRLLASHHMQSHAEEFQHYLSFEYGDIGSYCGQVVEQMQTEMEQLTLKAAIEVLFRPAGFGLTVVSLYESGGDSVDIRSHIDAVGNSAAHTAHLFFYPTHFDILYERGPLHVLRSEAPDVTDVVNCPHDMSFTFIPEMNDPNDPLSVVSALAFNLQTQDLAQLQSQTLPGAQNNGDAATATASLPDIRQPLPANVINNSDDPRSFARDAVYGAEWQFSPELWHPSQLPRPRQQRRKKG